MENIIAQFGFWIVVVLSVFGLGIAALKNGWIEIVHEEDETVVVPEPAPTPEPSEPEQPPAPTPAPEPAPPPAPEVDEGNPKYAAPVTMEKEELLPEPEQPK